MAGSQKGGRRRFWRVEEKRRIVAEARDRRNSVSMVARRHDLNTNQLFTWMRDPRLSDVAAPAAFVPVEIVDAAASASSGPPSSVAGGDLEIAMPCGAVIRCGADVDVDALFRVVSALRRGE